MKVVAFNGSPRKDGNTNLMLQRALEPIAEAGIETELVQLGGEPLAGCKACGGCRRNQDQRCVITTDKLNEHLARMIAADGIVLGSPTYFADMTTEMKALIDRAGYVAMANGRIFRRKIGAGVVVHRRGGAVHVLDSINHLFLISQMIIPGSTYWNFGVGRELGEVAQDQEAMANMKDLGQAIAWLVKSLHGAQAQG